MGKITFKLLQLATKMEEERCVFPHSNNSIYSPTKSFPWHEERFGNRNLHTELWKIFDELTEKKCDIKKIEMSFKEAVRKILVGRQINIGIQVVFRFISIFKKNYILHDTLLYRVQIKAKC